MFHYKNSKMKNIIGISTLLAMMTLLFSSCKKDWLERTPKDIILEEQVWNDPVMITGLLANYYDRFPTETGLEGNFRNAANYADAMWSGYSGEDWRNNIINYGFESWRYWDYGLIRDINLALESIEAYGEDLSDTEKVEFSAELRFQRAFIYFEMVKRMGGVPLVTSQLIYDYSGDPSALQLPRAKESEIYDFIASEVDAIKDQLGNSGSHTRANKYTALALKSRAMLYAGSLAKYNNQLGNPIQTANGEVGIPASQADDYYRKSLEASLEIINSGVYSLYQNNPEPGANFQELFLSKTDNPEVIFAKDFLSEKNKRHGFSYENIVRSVREDNLASSGITPGLGLVESYEYLNGSNGKLKIRNADNSDFIYYDDPADLFADKDGRLYGTVIYPGSTFKGLEIEVQAGVMVWNASTGTYQTIEGSALGSNYTDGQLLTSAAGPHRSIQEVSNTGFYLRKYVDIGAGTSTRGILSDVWWIWFRLGEIYLNAAEAAFELGQANAVDYVNVLRERAGFGSNSLSNLTLERIRNERRVELAFEDHRLWDLKRWRIAHSVWNGSASNEQAMIYALYPYRVIRPSDPARDGKYVFVKMQAPRFRAPRFFRVENYYSSIAQDVRNNNPKITPNPGH